MKIHEITDLHEARIDELVGVKGRGLNDLKTALDQSFSQRRVIRSFVEELRTNRWISLGAGAYGSVFTHPNLNYCIKMFTKDPAYLRFVKFCQENSAPCLPKFRGKLMRVDNQTFAVRMETLAPIRGNTAYEITFIISDFASGTGCDMTAEEYLAHIGSGSGPIEEYFNQNPDLLPTLEKLRTMADPTEWDIGVNNVMLRGDTLVITDPWAE